MSLKKYFSIFLLIHSLFSCSVHKPQEAYLPLIETQKKFYKLELQPSKKNWYYEFENKNLNNLIKQAFENNLDIKQAWSRILQATYDVDIAKSHLWPQLNSEISVVGQDSETKREFSQNGWIDQISFATNLSWQIDLWGKIKAGENIVKSQLQIRNIDYLNTKLFLSGNITKTYFDLLANQDENILLQKQVQTNKKLLELVQLRNALGKSSLNEIKQQEQQLLALQAQSGLIFNNKQIFIKKLAVLLGKSPLDFEYELNDQLPLIPPLPFIDKPANLIISNPVIQTKYYNLKQADYEIAVAVADRFPNLNFQLNYKISNLDIKDSLENSIFSISGSILRTVFDAKRKKNEVLKSKEKFQEKLYEFSNSYITVVKEVANALSTEKYFKQKLENTQQQILLLQLNLDETTFKYSNGLTDYTSVLNDLQRLQNFQKQYIKDKRDLLEARINLHMSVGSTIL